MQTATLGRAAGTAIDSRAPEQFQEIMGQAIKPAEAYVQSTQSSSMHEQLKAAFLQPQSSDAKKEES